MGGPPPQDFIHWEMFRLFPKGVPSHQTRGLAPVWKTICFWTEFLYTKACLSTGGQSHISIDTCQRHTPFLPKLWLYIHIYTQTVCCTYCHTCHTRMLIVCVCTYICVYIYIYIHIYIHIYIYTHTPKHVHMIYICAYAYTYIRVHIHRRRYTYTYTHIHIRTYTHMNIHTHTDTQIHTHVHTCTHTKTTRPTCHPPRLTFFFRQDRADTDGLTPLCAAAANGHRAVVECLLEAGADKDGLARGFFGLLKWVPFNNTPTKGDTPQTHTHTQTPTH